jgi:GT2 family glycosyltransferase
LNPTNPLLSVVLPVRDQWPLTEQCLHALRASTPEIAMQVIVVDNASTDETAAHCAVLGTKLFNADFSCLRQKHNLGFGRACNLGAQFAQGDLLCILNNDTVPLPGWFTPLHQALNDHQRVGAVGPLLLYPDSRRVQHVGVAFCPRRNVHHLHEHFPAEHPLVRKPRQVQALTAAALLLPRRLFLGLGGFHEGYQNGFEDLELCARIRGQGLHLQSVPHSVILHYTSQTAGRFDRDQDNAKLFRQRCADLITPDLHLHLREDGLELRLTPWLLPHAAMPDQDVAALQHRTGITTEAWTGDNAILDELLELLEGYPLWELGYNAAAHIAEARKQWSLALDLRLRQVNLCPSQAAYTFLLRAALKCGQRELAAETETKIRIINRILADPRTRRKAAALQSQLSLDTRTV